MKANPSREWRGVREPLRVGLLLLLVAGWLVGGCGKGGVSGSDEHGEAGHDEHAAEEARGPQGGRLFHADDRTLELSINDEGPEPVMQAWLYGPGMKTVRPSGETLNVMLTRFTGRTERVTFRVDGEHFHSNEGIAEPHSFAAVVRLVAGGKTHTWEYEQQEGRVELAREALASSGIEVGTAGPALLGIFEEAPGEVHLDRNRVIVVHARYPGILRSLRKRLGDPVRKGEVLAVVQSSESLADYTITAPQSGTVIAQEAAAGQVVGSDEVLLTVADLSTVWVDFPIYAQNVGRIRTGRTALVSTASGPAGDASGTVHYVGPLLEQDTRVSFGRISLPNRDRRWQPGMFVTVRVTVEDVTVAVAVPEDAIVRFSTGPAVFRARGTMFESQPVTIGRTDLTRTEVLDGLAPGDTIVTRNAFLLKAELGKSEAHHDH
jgi:cobalt-zinc-cadmium efflux system membrane fusion protein